MKRVLAGKLAGHYHDTYGQALANIYASLEMGVATFDSSVVDFGGCPRAYRSEKSPCRPLPEANCAAPAAPSA